jgi:hypothetical protein
MNIKFKYADELGVKDPLFEVTEIRNDPTPSLLQM